MLDHHFFFNLFLNFFLISLYLYILNLYSYAKLGTSHGSLCPIGAFSL